MGRMETFSSSWCIGWTLLTETAKLASDNQEKLEPHVTWDFTMHCNCRFYIKKRCGKNSAFFLRWCIFLYFYYYMSHYVNKSKSDVKKMFWVVYNVYCRSFGKNKGLLFNLFHLMCICALIKIKILLKSDKSGYNLSEKLISPQQ